jgi:xylulokinase
MTAVLALDIGTSAVKAAVIVDGVILAVTEEAHPLSNPAPGWAEQNPQDWWAATCTAVRRLTGSDDRASRVDVVSVTGQMQDLIPLDDRGEPVRPAILYSDTRATLEHQDLAAQMGDPWARAVGAAPDATSVASKWRWMTTHEPQRAARTAMVLMGGHSYVVAQLTGGTWVCDPSTAASTGLFELATGNWWTPVVEAVRCPVPEIRSATSRAGLLDATVAGALGLDAGIPVIHANGDAVATTIGLVGTQTDRPYAYLGTSGWVAVGTSAPSRAPGTILLPGVDGHHWIAAAPMPTAGAAVDWARHMLLGDIDHEQMDRMAASVCAAEHGVLFLPHLDGARTPYLAPDATGVLLGARRSTAAATVAAAVYEGVAHAVRELAAVIAPDCGQLAVCGGAARSRVLRQTLADVTGYQIVQVADEHAALIGAATVAHLALGAAPLLPPRPEECLDPDPDRRDIHRQTASLFDQLLPTLAPLFTSLVGIRSEEPTTSA